MVENVVGCIEHGVDVVEHGVDGYVVEQDDERA
jgi:hypothetical protein